MENTHHIYHIALKSDRPAGYDSYSDFVVVAEDESAARKAIEMCGSECRHLSSSPEKCVWLHPEKTTCVQIGTALSHVRHGVIVNSFHAG